jgi:EAL domain-containing protein (putative c-di-GMP-specific phosphodiesterase class I)
MSGRDLVNSGGHLDHDSPAPGDARTARDRIVSLYGERALPQLIEEMDGLAERLMADEAVGLILVDASAMAEIERLHGARSFRQTLGTLAERLHSRLARDDHGDFHMVSGALREEHVLIFFHRPRADCGFYADVLPRLADDLRDYVEMCIRRVVYPYLTDPCEVAVGHGSMLVRPFQRPEVQIRSLIESTLEAARFGLERVEHERAETLRQILHEANLRTVYQPIVQLKDRQVLGYEALTRGPAGSGLETPHNLFKTSQHFNMEYELDSLCRRLALRNAQGIQPGEKLFLNILPTSIHDPDFTNVDFQEVLNGLGLAPHNLVLEISEQQAIVNFPVFREAIDHFLKLGFGIALDDTGAGYANLEAALELNPNFLKIDISLIHGIDESVPRQELLRGLGRLAEKMGARVIAEGIETEAELEMVRELGCAYGQGYAIGREHPICRPPKLEEDF